MRRHTAGLLCLLALGSAGRHAGAAPPDSQTVPDAPYPAEFRTRVNAEIEKGAKALLDDLTQEGDVPLRSSLEHDVGERALVLLTLLQCGVPKENPAIDAAFRRLRKAPPKQTYDVGIFLMALAARYEVPLDPFAEDVIDASGRHVVPTTASGPLVPDDQAWMESGVKFLLKHQIAWVWSRSRPPPKPPSGKSRGGAAEPKEVQPEAARGWGYPRGMEVGWIDISNTQYALLGLKAASRCGVAVPAKAWAATLSLLLEWQASEGESVTFRANEVRGTQRLEWKESARARGFDYSGSAYNDIATTGGCTVAGACGLLICQSELLGSSLFPATLQSQTREAIRDALAWMQVKFTVDRNPNTTLPEPPKGKKLAGGGKVVMPLEDFDPWYACYLYGLERMGVLGHVRFLGEHDWYQKGAEKILARRARPDHDMTDYDSCFELLFLRRASFRTSNAAITEGDGPLPPAPPAPAAPGPVPPIDPPGK